MRKKERRAGNQTKLAIQGDKVEVIHPPDLSSFIVTNESERKERWMRYLLQEVPREIEASMDRIVFFLQLIDIARFIRELLQSR